MLQERPNEREPTQKIQHKKDRYRTCCNICHIKCGTVFLGAIEAAVAIIVLITVIQQIIWKNHDSAKCSKNFLRDCLIFQFNHFNITLIFDYIVVLMMAFILLSVLLLMCGILSDTSCLILPHLAVQGLFLLFSLGYFVLHAWSYFYGDLYTHSRPFLMQSLIERMWLAALLLILAGFQTYLFSAVVRCSMYVSLIEEARRQRGSAFERCSERVRVAKENGLWRTTSWGGGFQQYKGQPEERKKKQNKGFRVKWNFNQNVVVEDEETPLTDKIEEPANSSPPRPSAVRTDSRELSAITVPRPETSKPHSEVRKPENPRQRTDAPSTTRAVPGTSRHHQPVVLTEQPRVPGRSLGERAERRRSSQMSNLSDEVRVMHKEGKIAVQHTPRIHSESPKKDRPRHAVHKTPSDGSREHRDSPLRVELSKTASHAKHEPKIIEVHKEPRPSTSYAQRRTERVTEVEKMVRETEDPKRVLASESMNKRVRTTVVQQRAPLRSYKSVDSEEGPPTDTHGHPRKEHRTPRERRRSSHEAYDVPTVTHHIRAHPHRTQEKRPETQVVKKVSITSTTLPQL